jgi:hypothetical protein
MSAENGQKRAENLVSGRVVSFDRVGELARPWLYRALRSVIAASRDAVLHCPYDVRLFLVW